MRLLVLVLAALVGGCYVSAPTVSNYPVNTVEMARELNSQTVGLFMADESAQLSVFCTGVWISPTEILTAGHCSEAAQEAGNDPEPVGTMVWYATSSEVGEVETPPTSRHLSQVVAHDHEHDLSLLRVRGLIPAHQVAHVASELAPQGERLYFMGQPSGLYWTFVEGCVAANRDQMEGNLGFKGPFMQVSAPIWFGNSGGGAFDHSGNLVGISSFLQRRTPNTAFYIAVPSIQKFLTKARLANR